MNGTLRVIYRWDGFLQPINDTAHQQGAYSVFKAGSTVPVKFQLKDANGNIVQAAILPGWAIPVAGSSITASINETVYSDPASSGMYFRWDSTSQQYIYNWRTANNQSGRYYRIYAMLDDGQNVYVDI